MESVLLFPKVNLRNPIINESLFFGGINDKIKLTFGSFKTKFYA